MLSDISRSMGSPGLVDLRAMFHIVHGERIHTLQPLPLSPRSGRHVRRILLFRIQRLIPTVAI